MPRANKFIFKDYEIDMPEKVCRFRYQIIFSDKDPLEFEERIELPADVDFSAIPEELLERHLKALHIVLGVSYYKLYVPGEFVVPYNMSAQDAKFWNNVYEKGLGEFLYRNGLKSSDLAKFSEEKDKKMGIGSALKKTPLKPAESKKYLIGIGGGKDSIVMMEKLKEMGHKPMTFVLETQRGSEVIDKVIECAGLESLKVKRYLDPQIFEEHEGSYNGHVPISAIIAFVGTFLATVAGYDYVVVGNEFSSNFGNLEHEGKMINHQWSKSQEFEDAFREYGLRNFGDRALYFSLLRCFYELRIVKEFINYPQYFEYFTSCNRAFKINKERSGKLWCGECAKCAFLFLMLSAFLRPTELEEMFGENLFDKKELVSEYRDLLGFGDKKPFDCVGTFAECRAALLLASQNGYADSLIIQEFLKMAEEVIDEERVKDILRMQESPLLAVDLKLQLAKDVVIVGYGKEGKVTESYLKAKYPKVNYEISDQATDEKYLETIKKYDLAIKTPGLPGRLMPIDYITATQLFFQASKGMFQIVAVTGSKGKSTTTTLTHQILEKAGFKAKLLGNIGTPMLTSLLESQDDDAVFVLELSSYQLQELKLSPDVAVLINLFPEHLDYHGSELEYYDVKLNIARYQTEGDVFIYAPETLSSGNNTLLDDFSVIKTDYLENDNVDNWNLKLLGQHNIDNAKAAVAVAKLFDIDESIVKEVVENFEGLSHRLEKVGEFKGITFYDDAISTTPESTIAALKALKDVETIFLGGTDRGYDFAELEKVLNKSSVKNVVLFPESGERIIDDESEYNVLKTDSMKEAVEFAYANTTKGMVCLLSTASPSYSLWKNFEVKGDEFVELVKLLGA